MINTYCENLRETFAQMVYYGILKEEDAQCFRVEARLENAAYILAAASVALALLNTFVMRAVNQYFRDADLTVREFKATPSRDGEETEDVTIAVRRVTPVPVLFSDAFRWFLVREDSDPSRRLFVAKDGQDVGIDGITTRDMPESGSDLMADHIEVEELEPTPFDNYDYDDYVDYADGEDIFEDPKSFFHGGGGISSVPQPRQPEILPSGETVLSSEAARDSTSGGVSLDYQTPEPTVLSAISELTEPQTEPWREV